MSYQRLIRRNGLTGDYAALPAGFLADTSRTLVAGDLRRFERDQRDDRHTTRIAARVGITPEQVRAVLDIVLGEDCEGQTYG